MRYNLNLLKIFVVIAEELNLGKAAKKLRLGQPALSHALKNLREEFGDPLFVRVPSGLAPTARAETLTPQIRDILRSIEGIYNNKKDLVLEEIKTHFVIGATGYFELRLTDSVFPQILSEAQNVTLQTLALHGEFPKRELESGEMHLAIAAYFEDLPPGFRLLKLGTDPIVCLMRKGHPYLKEQGLKSYLKYTHLKIDVPVGSKSQFDIALEQRHLKRKIRFFASNFTSPPFILSNSNLILTCPQSLASRYKEQVPLCIAPAPISSPDIDVKMVWHERFQHDPFHRWVRSLISSLSNKK